MAIDKINQIESGFVPEYTLFSDDPDLNRRVDLINFNPDLCIVILDQHPITGEKRKWVEPLFSYISKQLPNTKMIWICWALVDINKMYPLLMKSNIFDLAGYDHPWQALLDKIKSIKK